MNDAWLKIKAWTKGILVALIAIYALFFIYNNSGDVTFWWFFKHEHQTTVVTLAAWGFLAGVVTTLVLWTTFNTIRQMRSARVHARTDNLEREMADMKAKAAMLQPRPPATSPAGEGVTVQVDRLGDHQ